MTTPSLREQIKEIITRSYLARPTDKGIGEKVLFAIGYTAGSVVIWVFVIVPLFVASRVWLLLNYITKNE